MGLGAFSYFVYMFIFTVDVHDIKRIFSNIGRDSSLSADLSCLFRFTYERKIINIPLFQSSLHKPADLSSPGQCLLNCPVLALSTTLLLLFLFIIEST